MENKSIPNLNYKEEFLCLCFLLLEQKKTANER